MNPNLADPDPILLTCGGATSGEMKVPLFIHLSPTTVRHSEFPLPGP